MNGVDKVVAREGLEELAKELRAKGARVVTTNGCFDILHVGHVRILQQARALGDVLLVAINSDESVRKLKGPSRPINSQDDRAELLGALACVDFVTIFGEDTPVAVLQLVKPDVHVKGADYKPENLAETPVVESYGGRVEILQLIPGRSTTNVVARIQAQ